MRALPTFLSRSPGHVRFRTSKEEERTWPWFGKPRAELQADIGVRSCRRRAGWR